MNKYALNIDTKQLKKKILYINNFNNKYTFLDHMNLDNISIYYDILNNIEEYKLKNIYNFIYKRINYLDKIQNIPENIYKKELEISFEERLKERINEIQQA